MKFNDRRVAKDKGAGCGGVLQTEYGVIRALLSGPVEDLGEDIATLVAIKSALEIFVMSNWIGKANLGGWWKSFVDIDQLSAYIKDVHSFYIYRVGNVMALTLVLDGKNRYHLFKAWWWSYLDYQFTWQGIIGVSLRRQSDAAKEKEKLLAQQTSGREPNLWWEADIEKLSLRELEDLDSRYTEHINRLYDTISKKVAATTDANEDLFIKSFAASLAANAASFSASLAANAASFSASLAAIAASLSASRAAA
ncbi:hypothetical protein V6N11_037876 [Hibiscus sabdariffa]|uniref:Uncharacterized protein n=1 Tax=Hibiscus sabdariffa TaxID=183260 RepID=A0ABR2A6D4_9ROSI